MGWHSGLNVLGAGPETPAWSKKCGVWNTLGTELGLTGTPHSTSSCPKETYQITFPRNPSTTSPAEKPCVPHVKANSFTCCLFLQVPDFNSLLSSHLILQASGICKHNIDVYLFPQAPLELTPEFLQPYLMTAWRWQRGEQPLARSILCDWFQHPNPGWVEDYESLLRIATALQPAVRELDSQKEREFRLASSFHISYLWALSLLWEGWPPSIPLWAVLFFPWIS